MLLSTWRSQTSSYQQGSVFQHVDRHHPREDLPNRLLDYQILGFSRQVPPPSFCQDVTAVTGPHGIPGMVCSPGLSQDAPFSVATENNSGQQLLCSYEASSSIGRVQGVHPLTASGEIGIGNSPPGAPSLSSQDSKRVCHFDEQRHYSGGLSEEAGSAVS